MDIIEKWGRSRRLDPASARRSQGQPEHPKPNQTAIASPTKKLAIAHSQGSNSIMERQTFKVIALGDRHSLVKLTDRIALITQALKRPGKAGRLARVVAGYFGFATEAEAIAFVDGLRRHFPKAFCQVRSSQRLASAFEVKVRAFDGLEKFAWVLVEKAAIVTEPATPRTNIVSFDRANAPVMIRSNRPRKVAGLAID